MIYLSMFEWDEKKNRTNQEKHGISFKQAISAWSDCDSVDFKSKNNSDEIRFLKIAKIENKFYAIIYTFRSSNVRIISVRRARNEEKEIYKKNL